MPDRYIRPLKIACFVLAALLLGEISFAILKGDPLAHVVIPPLPRMPGDTNSAPTNAVADLAQKDIAAEKRSTNTATNGTNKATATNVVTTTNPPVSTNLVAATNAPKSTNTLHSTNIVNTTTNSSNSVAARGRGGRRAGANAGADMPAGMSPDMMAMMGGGGRGGPRMELPPDVQARVNRIVNSEMLGPIMHPMPMALLGIADDEAFLRATNGQTGPVKVGKEMGGIKLLKIGINRVLVETDGEKKELILFGGIGSESLMPKPSDTPPTNSISPMASAKGMKTNQTGTNSLRSSKPKETP